MATYPEIRFVSTAAEAVEKLVPEFEVSAMKDA
jgi:hypothetical protein